MSHFNIRTLPWSISLALPALCLLCSQAHAADEKIGTLPVVTVTDAKPDLRPVGATLIDQNSLSGKLSGTSDTAQNYFGKTSITAVYAQDAWQLHPDLTLTSGWRQEQFDSFDGSQFFTGVAPVTYAARSLSGGSPKLSLAWAARDDLLVKASAGKGVRFPNVDELFNGSKTGTGTSITVNDPNLRPERSASFELSAEKFIDKHTLRASLFRDDVADTILRQSDSTVTPSVTRVSNVDRVVTNGIELAWQSRDVGIKGLDVSGNATWADARVAENAALPASVGKNWLRIPKQRYTLQTAYRPNEQSIHPTWVDWVSVARVADRERCTGSS